MAKKGKGQVRMRRAHVATPPNPFDVIANPRTKHDVLNRKVKGQNRNVGLAREKVPI